MFRSISLIIVFAIFLQGCATNPVTGKSELGIVSQAEEINIGNTQYVPAQQSQGGAYTVDPELTKYVNEVGSRLAAVSDNPLPYEFVVLNNSTPNAWALPGGKIAINRGLMLQLENEAELAAVLGHEIVHAAARHGAKALERSIFVQGAVLITAVSVSDSTYSNQIMEGAQVGAQLITQKYGRSAELESDVYGMEYMARVGYDPDAAVTLQQKFVALNKQHASDWVGGLFASHPPSQERVAKNRETANKIKSNRVRDWELGTERYQQKMAYLRSKADAYRAFDQAQTLIGNKEFSVARSRVDQAIKLEPKEARFHGLKADLLVQQKQYQDAIVSYTRAIALDGNYYAYYLGRGLSYREIGRKQNARDDLEHSNQLLPTSIATNALGSL